MSSAELLARSRQELDAADLFAKSEFGSQAISRAYFAASYAAEAALLEFGQTRSKHAGVIAAFGQLVVRGTGSFAADDARLLRSLFERRNEADYAHAPVPEEEVTEAIIDARRFVTAVETWVAARRASGPSPRRVRAMPKNDARNDKCRMIRAHLGW